MTKRSSWWTWLSLIAAAAAPLYSARVQAAAALCSTETELPKLIWFARTLNAGHYVIETANITGDTVMHVLKANPSGGPDQQWVEVASNDDFNGLASSVTIDPTVTTSYQILVRSYSAGSTGVADLRINGVTYLTQNPYGGLQFAANWNPGEQYRVTSTRRTTSVDPLLFLLTSNLHVSQSNDDSGPNRYPVIDATGFGTSTSRVVWGHFPGYAAAGYGRLTISPKYAASGDSDSDLVMNTLEVACGMNASKVDSDADTVPDVFELFGNDGWSMSLGSQYGNNPTRRNVYVEVDTMNSPQVTVPDVNLAADMATIFNTDAAIDIYVDAPAVATLTYSQNVAFNNCGSVAGCTLLSTIRANNFSTVAPERAPYFHYVVYGDRWVDDTKTTPPVSTCSSGYATLLGSNVLISLGCAGGPTTDQRRGTTMHELGHNLNLVHNRNDAPSRNYSTVHVSVMNYYYQFMGVTTRAGVLKHSYSFGTNACASCATSPKQYCIDFRTMSPTNGCNIAPNCDCDVNEWGTWLTTDFYNGTRNSGAGAAPGAEPGLATTETHAFKKDKDGKEVAPILPPGQTVSMLEKSAKKGLIDDVSPAEFAPVRDAMSANLAVGKEGQLKATQPDKWKGPVPDIATPRRKKLVAAQVEDLKARGFEKDKDFVVNAEGTEVYQRCP